MKKLPVFTAVIIILGLAACRNPLGGSGEMDNKDGENTGSGTGSNTTVVFNNTQGICAVAVYEDPRRRESDKIAEVPEESISNIIPWNVGTPTFYFSYLVGFHGVEGIKVAFVPPMGEGNQQRVRIDPEKKTVVDIPALGDVSLPDMLLSQDVYLIIDNRSLSSFTLTKSGTTIKPENLPGDVVNIKEDAIYRISAESSSVYYVEVGGQTKSFSVPSFETGHVYRFTLTTALTITSLKMDFDKKFIPENTARAFVPRNVHVERVLSSEVQIRWDKVSGASGYNVYRSNSDGGTGAYEKVNTAIVSETTYSDNTNLAGTTVYYKISAIKNNDNIESEMSKALEVTIPLPAPGNPQVSAKNSSSVSFVWDAVSGTSGYNVYRSTSGEAETYSKVYTATASETTYTDTYLASFTLYYYKVCAVSSGGFEGEWSNVVSANTGIVVPGSDLAAKLAWLQSNAASDTMYHITINAGESIDPQTLSYSGESNITITLKGEGTMRTVNLSTSGALFTVESGVTLILDSNITLSGRSSNTDAVVWVKSGGSLVMNEGAKITGNTVSYSNGGGVYVSSGTFTMNGGEISGNTTSSGGGGVYVSSGTFIMNGGEISGNSAYYYGGGVYASGSGTIFRMGGGVIYGSSATTGLKNTAYSGAALYCSGGTAQYGTFSGNVFTSSGSLSTTSNTVQVVNGVLQNN